MTVLLGKRGTVRPIKTGHSPESNGSAKCSYQKHEEKGRALLEDAGLEPELWAKGISYRHCTRNVVPSSVHGKTSKEIFYKKPSLSHLQAFGAIAYILVPKGNEKKMKPVNDREVFLRYEPKSISYRVFEEPDGSNFTSRNVIVDECWSFVIVELGSILGKEERSGRGPSRESAPDARRGYPYGGGQLRERGIRWKGWRSR